MIDDGTEWFSDDGSVWHKRGWMAQGITFGDTDDRLSGPPLVEINWNVDLTSWSGNLQGSADYTSDVYPHSGWPLGPVNGSDPAPGPAAESVPGSEHSMA